VRLLAASQAARCILYDRSITSTINGDHRTCRFLISASRAVYVFMPSRTKITSDANHQVIETNEINSYSCVRVRSLFFLFLPPLNFMQHMHHEIHQLSTDVSPPSAKQCRRVTGTPSLSSGDPAFHQTWPAPRLLSVLLFMKISFDSHSASHWKECVIHVQC